MQYKFNGKTIVISGISRGIGKALALKSARLGMKVAGLDVNQENLDVLKNELKKSGAEFYLDTVDIRNEAACKVFIDNCIKNLGSIDLLINNAGITHIAPENETEIEHTQNVMDVNFMGTVHLTHYALPYIVKNKGVVAGVSSVAGFSPLLYRTAYAASKHAVWGYLGSLRAEMKSENVQVLTICPSFVKTELQENQQKYFNNKVKIALTPEYVADEILKAITKKKDVVLIGKIAKQVYWFNKFIPKLYEKIMIKKMT